MYNDNSPYAFPATKSQSTGAYMTYKIAKGALVIVFLLAFLGPAFSFGGFFGRSPIRDVEKEAGSKLEKNEIEIAQFVFTFYAKKYGYSDDGASIDKIANRMSEDEYANTVKQAAKTAKNPVAKGLLATGKAGEKVLKALIVTAEDSAKNAGEWIDRKSKEYDERNKK
jgi:hypothetical protein